MDKRYRVERLIGEGTYAWVFSAHDTTADPLRRVAVKVLRPEHADAPETIQRFHDRELTLLRRVEQVGPSPNVVQLLEHELCMHRGLLFIVLEHIDGPSLRERLSEKKPFGSDEAAKIGRGIALGLAALHAAGVVHRDLKPGNIILRNGNVPVIIDLGIAACPEAASDLTATGKTPMTPRYAAPEQQAGKQVDASCDIYALGVILEEMAVAGKLLAIARRCMAWEPSRRPGAMEVADHLHRCLEREPSRRPGAMEVPALRDGLLRALQGWRNLASAAGRALAAVGAAASSPISDHSLSIAETPRWTPAASMQWGREGHTSTRLTNGEVLVVGGYDASARAFVDCAERYDPVHDRWIKAGAFGPRTLHAATLLPGGDVLVVGGVSRGDWLAVAARYIPEADTWRSAAPMSAARAALTATWLPGVNRVLVAGGHDARGVHSTSEVYDPATDRWTSSARMSIARAAHAALWIPGVDRALVLGGIDARGFSAPSVELYDPVANEWAHAAPMSTGRDRFTATLLADGRVLVAGGMSNGAPLASVEVYDPAAERWTEAAPMHTARAHHAAMLLLDGRLLVMGGAASADAEIYDPAQDRWTAVGAPARRRAGPSMTLLVDGRALVAGGSGAEASACDLFDPGSSGMQLRAAVGPRWTPAAPMYAGRAAHAMTLLSDGRVLVVGAPRDTSINVAEIYEPRANSWAAPVLMTAAPPGRAMASVTLLPGTGEALIAGGGHPDGVHRSTERYDPARNAFAPAAPMRSYRKAHTATLLPGGEVLAVGGYGAGLHADTERYDPVRDVWRAAAQMQTPRQFHVAALLPDGRVLVAGGMNGAHTLERSCEFYDSTADTWTPGAPLTFPRRGGVAMSLRDGRIMVAGGYGEATGEIGAEIYDPKVGRWQTAAPMRAPRCGSAALALTDGKVVVAGGRRGASTCLDSVEIYDPDRDAWIDVAPMRTKRCEAAAVLLTDGRILVTGGFDEGRALSSAEIYVVE
ncbi:protein kinase [Sorangium sp. So ce834]|uniref:kelch repeat-containing protein n=1 Tax=Sorangium sp. So ce834 TaxID=3133321 RepID=UPI003F604535